MSYHELTIALQDAARKLQDEPQDARWNEITHLEWAMRSMLRTIWDYRETFRRTNADRPLTRWDLEGDTVRKQLEAAPPGAPACLSCGQKFTNDGEFWRHYVIEDLNHPTFGRCWRLDGREPKNA